MPNIKVKESEKAKTRAVSLSDNQVREIKKLTGCNSLTLAIREMITIIKNSTEE